MSFEGVKTPPLRNNMKFLNVSRKLKTRIKICNKPPKISLQGSNCENMKTLTLFLLLTITINANSQAPQQPILIVPFETVMYKSMIDKELAAGSKFNWQEVHQQVRDAIQTELMQRMRQYWQVRAISQHDSIDGMLLERQIFSYLSYEATPVLAKAGKQPDNRLKLPKIPGQKPKEIEQSPGTQIKNGEIVTVRETREMAMKTIITNPEAYSAALNVLKCESALFITQLDLEMVPGVYGMDDRVATIHFTLLNAAGEEISVGKFRHHFNSTGLTLDSFNKLVVRQMISGFSEMLQQNLSTQKN